MRGASRKVEWGPTNRDVSEASNGQTRKYFTTDAPGTQKVELETDARQERRNDDSMHTAPKSESGPSLSSTRPQGYLSETTCAEPRHGPIGRRGVRIEGKHEAS